MSVAWSLTWEEFASEFIHVISRTQLLAAVALRSSSLLVVTWGQPLPP